MTAESLSPSAAGPGSGAPAGASVWLFGRGVDLLLGYGLGYLIGVPLLLALGLLASPESRTNRDISVAGQAGDEAEHEGATSGDNPGKALSPASCLS